MLSIRLLCYSLHFKSSIETTKGVRQSTTTTIQNHVTLLSQYYFRSDCYIKQQHAQTMYPCKRYWPRNFPLAFKTNDLIVAYPSNKVVRRQSAFSISNQHQISPNQLPTGRLGYDTCCMHITHIVTARGVCLKHCFA